MRTESLKGGLLSALIVASLMVPAISLLSVNQASALPEGLNPHNPIFIDSNDNFTPANGVTAGSGTENDPYIIENWDISAENAHGIEIDRTTAYFIIRNCYVHDGRRVRITNGVSSSGHQGIRFDYASNGKIDNTTLDNNFMGITMSGSNNIISNTIIKGNAWGILLYSNNNLIENCIIENNSSGIRLWDSDNNLISNNIVENNERGISLDFSENNFISNNIAGNNSESISLWDSDNNLISNNLVKNNHSYGIDLHGSDNNFVTNNTVENNGRGIYLADSDNNLVTNNLVENNRYGIYLIGSSNNIIDTNIAENNKNGIKLSYGSKNQVIIVSDNNLIFHNNFFNDNNQAFDDGINYWDDGYPSGGNYWSDYTGVDTNNDGIGDTPYNIPGKEETNQDRYPLMNPFVPDAILPEEAPPTRWPLIAGIVGVIAIIIIVALYMRRRKPTEFRW